MKKFFSTAGWTVLHLSVYFTLQLIYIFIASFVLAIKFVLQNPEIDPDTIAENLEPLLAKQLPLSIIVSSIIAFGLYYLFSKARKQDFFQVCQFSKISLKNALLFVPAGMGLVFINGLLLSLINRTEVMDNAFSKHVILMEQLLGGNAIIVFLSVAIAAPFIEEIIFRGLVLNELKKSMSVKWAVLLQALLFGLYHMQLVQGIYTFFMGILLGLVCVWLRSIWPAIILHLFNNLTSVVLSRMDNIEFLEKLEIPLVIISMILVSAVMIYAYRVRIQEKENTQIDVETTIIN